MLSKIINNWLKDEAVPQYILTSRIVLLYKTEKNDDGNSLSDFRPISVTSYIFKLIEKMLKNRIDTGIKNNLIKELSKDQFGFRNQLGTEQQLLRILITVNELKKQHLKDQIYVVFFDFKQAFDMVNWNNLFSRLAEYNFGVDIIKALKILF